MGGVGWVGCVGNYSQNKAPLVAPLANQDFSDYIHLSGGLKTTGQQISGFIGLKVDKHTDRKNESSTHFSVVV